MEQNDPVRSAHRFFKIYTSVMLTLAVILLAAIIALLSYGGVRVADEAKAVNDRVNDFSGQIDKINANLENINKSLQSTDSRLPANLPSNFSY